MQDKNTKKAINLIVSGFIKKSRRNFKFSVFAISIGVWGLIVISSVINGFDISLIKSITNFYPHIISLGNNNVKDKEILESFNFNLDGCMLSNSTGYQFVQYIETNKSDFFSKNIISGKSEKDGIVVGKELATIMNTNVGDEITFFKLKGFLPVSKKYKITGLFKSGVYIFDSKYVILNDTESLKSYTGYILKHPENAQNIKEKLFSSYNALTWKESNQTLAKTVEIDSLLAFLITFFVILMSGFSISNSIRFSILTRKREIGILNSLGLEKREVSKIFINESLIICFVGYTVGLLAGIFTSFIINLLKIPLPSGIFYVDYLPVEINMSIVLLSFVITFGIVYIFSFMTTRSVLKFDPLEAIRDE